jgi:hypothetical protein
MKSNVLLITGGRVRPSGASVGWQLKALLPTSFERCTHSGDNFADRDTSILVCVEGLALELFNRTEQFVQA